MVKKRPVAVGDDKPCGHGSQDRAAAVSEIQVVAKRNPRIWFLGRRVAVDDGKADKAKVASQEARKGQQRWSAKQWRQEIDTVLKPFRKGISWGGNRPAIGDAQEQESRLAMESSAVVWRAAVEPNEVQHQ